MFVHFVLSTVIDTLQLVLAPSAPPRKMVKAAIAGGARSFAFQYSAGRHRSVAMAIMVGWLHGFCNEACPLKAQSESKAFQKRVSAVPGVSAVFGVPVLSAANPRTGGKG